MGFGFLRQSDGEIDVFAPPDAWLGIPRIQALAINNRGQITGTYLNLLRNFTAFLREPDGMITSFDAPSSHDHVTSPTAINPRGQITV
jgi:hypothetical protein